MRILILPSWYPSPLWHDLGDFVAYQAQALQHQGEDVHVLYPYLYSPKRIVKSGKFLLGKKKSDESGILHYRSYAMKSHVFSWDQAKLLRMGKRLIKKYIKEQGKPDIIHLHTFYSGEIALWIKKTYGIPYVVTEHYTGFARDIITPGELALAKMVYEGSSCNIAVSEPFKKLLEEKTREEFQAVPNLINTEYFRPGFEKDQGFTFVNVADMVEKKNQKLLLQAFRIVHEKNPHTRCLLIGEGPDRPMLEDLSKQLGLDGAVDFTGYCKRDMVLKHLQRSHCFVLPSLFETFGIVVIEALACGIPVIATPSGGPESILIHDELGRIVEGREDLLADAMLKQINNSTDPVKLHEWVVNHYSEKAICSRLQDIYQGVLTNE